jgi:hypothetical protein
MWEGTTNLLDPVRTFPKKNEVEFAFDISFNPIFAGKIRSILSDAKKLFHPRWERPTLLSKKKHAG